MAHKLKSQSATFYSKCSEVNLMVLPGNLDTHSCLLNEHISGSCQPMERKRHRTPRGRLRLQKENYKHFKCPNTHNWHWKRSALFLESHIERYQEPYKADAEAFFATVIVYRGREWFGVPIWVQAQALGSRSVPFCHSPSPGMTRDGSYHSQSQDIQLLLTPKLGQ